MRGGEWTIGGDDNPTHGQGWTRKWWITSREEITPHATPHNPQPSPTARVAPRGGLTMPPVTASLIS